MRIILLWLSCLAVGQAFPMLPPTSFSMATRCSPLHSLKPAAVPLMDAGKALATVGELLIDDTREEDLYGGPLSAAGAHIRNSGDCLAQAAASCRFKTGTELVLDELREASTCLLEATRKLQSSVEQGEVTGDLLEQVRSMILHVQVCATHLELAGRYIMERNSLSQIGLCLERAGDALCQVQPLSELGRQRCQYAGQQMKLAGQNLQGIVPKTPTGKSWLKGGG